MRVRGGFVTLVAAGVLAGCTATSPDAPTATSPPAAASSATPTPTAAVPTPPVGTRPVVECLDGTYRLDRFVDASPGAAYAGGRGGDVELRFSGQEFPDGNYVDTAYALVARGRTAMTLTGSDGTRSTLRATARTQGTYMLANDEAYFSRGTGTGSGRLVAGGSTTRLALAEVQALVEPRGTLVVSCTQTTLYLTGDDVQLVLTAS